MQLHCGLPLLHGPQVQLSGQLQAEQLPTGPQTTDGCRPPRSQGDGALMLFFVDADTIAEICSGNRTTFYLVK